MFYGKRVLITGGTGSFGQYMTRSLLNLDVSAKIMIFSRDEWKQEVMAHEFNDSHLEFMLGDVRDYARVEEAVRQADIVFHAAALKVIPRCEQNITEAIQTNINGTLNVKRACEKHCLSNSILLSTDKAVKPVNLYGMTKAVGEKIWLSAPCSLPVVRYGNVLGSRGSILPYFRQLIKEKKRIPLTHPNMTRFIITLQEAIELVMIAVKDNLWNVPRIYVPNIPAHTIVDFVEALAGKNYPVKIVGIRPGEKIHECLINEYEILNTQEYGTHYVISPGKVLACNVSDERRLRLLPEITSESARKLSVPELKRLIALVPEDHV